MGTRPRLGMHAWEAAIDHHRVGAQLMEDASRRASRSKAHHTWLMMIYTLSIAIAQNHVLPGPPIKLNLLTMLGPISSYSALV